MDVAASEFWTDEKKYDLDFKTTDPAKKNKDDIKTGYVLFRITGFQNTSWCVCVAKTLLPESVMSHDGKAKENQRGPAVEEIHLPEMAFFLELQSIRLFVAFGIVRRQFLPISGLCLSKYAVFTQLHTPEMMGLIFRDVHCC